MYKRKTVAFAKWQYPHTLSAQQKAEKEEEERNAKPRPEGTNFQLLEAFMTALDNKRMKWIDETKGYCEWHQISPFRFFPEFLRDIRGVY